MKDKDQIAQEFHSGNGCVIVATNAFGLGIDEPDICVVVYIRTIHQMPNYGQESGRVGRDGKRSQAIIMMPAGQQEALQKRHARVWQQPRRMPCPMITEADRERVEREKVEKFISGAWCRYIYLDQEMDGQQDQVRYEEGEERCDVCQKDDVYFVEAEALRQAYIREQEQEQRVVEEEEDDSGTTSGNAFPTSRNVDVTIMIADQEEFQAQQVERCQQQSQIIEASQQEACAIQDLENQLDKWMDKCPLCYVQRCMGQQVDV